MSWTDCDRTAAESDWLKLETDKAAARVCVLGAPVPRVSEFKGKVRKQIVFRVLCEGEVIAWSAGLRTYKKVRAHSDVLNEKALLVIRHGKKGDTSTEYDVTTADMTDDEQARVAEWDAVGGTGPDIETGEIPF